MIADDIVASIYRFGSSDLARRIGSAQVIEMPFAIVGAAISNEMRALIPARNGALEDLHAPWARPPFRKIVLISGGDALVYFEQCEDAELERAAPGRFAWAGESFCLALMSFRDRQVVVPFSFGVIGQTVDGSITRLYPSDHPDKAAQDCLEKLLRDCCTDDAQFWIDNGWTTLRGHGDAVSIAGLLLPQIATGFALLGCKNIRLEDIHPSRQLRRHAERAGGPRPFVYKRLMVTVPGAMRHRHEPRNDSDPQPLSLHWVRGHFKTFTQERPLFGSVAGTFWWTPRLRGSKKAGVVVKDYVVQVRP